MRLDNKKEHFIATYNFGPKPDQIKKQNLISNLFKTLIVMALKYMIYPGASFLKNKFIDPEREKWAHEQLITTGGQSVTMKTPDGDKIDGMYLRAKDFKEKIDKYCEILNIKDENGSIVQQLIIKDEFCKFEIEMENGTPFTIMTPNEEANTFIKNTIFKSLSSLAPRAPIPGKENVRGPLMRLGKIPINLKESPSQNSHPTVIIAPGSGLSYSAYKGLAAEYLIRGIDVMMIDFRGYGKSKGSPTSHKTKLDLEAAYQYVVKEHNVKNEDLLVHGHCLGGGPAADLAARKKGVNLILDRSFADYREVARERIPILRRIIEKIMPAIVNYNNVKNLQKVQGHIAIAYAKNDNVIPFSQTEKQIANLPPTDKHKAVIHSKGEHTGLWSSETTPQEQFNQFLNAIGFVA